MRSRINLNREWKFHRGDVAGAQAVDFDDSSWEPIGLPHTFDLPYFRTPEFYVGYGWYRKTLHLDGPNDKRFFLEFDGVFQEAEVFVNGTRVGEHRGGYTGFCVDFSGAARVGENVLTVRVNNNWNARVQPRAGEHVFCGGIYRDVYLLITSSLHLQWNSLCATTPEVSGESAVVRMQAAVRNDAAEPTTCFIAFQIRDPAGRVVAAALSPNRHVRSGETIEIEQTSLPIHAPSLWHPDHPYLYSVRAELYRDMKAVDHVTTRLGVRWFEWTADRGFFLNGEHLYLRGANVHQDHAGWGIAVTRAGCERDVRLIKEAGFNFIRGAHYPHHPAFADACDRLGVLFWSENAFWGKGGFGPEGYWNASAYPVDERDFAPFEESCKQQLAEMIRINRDHPSIIAWSITNEAFFTYNLDRAKKLMSDLVKLSRELDPTRPAAIGGAQRGDVDHLGDIAGYNGDGARLFINPGVPNMVSEYGAISKPHDAYEPFFGEKQTQEFPWRSGEAIWAGFDYGSIAGKQGLKGILDHFRLPKRSWHWYRKHLRGIVPPPWPIEGTPAKLRLDADKTTIQGTDATDDCQLIVTVCDDAGNYLSNSPPATLTIESGPGEFPTGPSITFAPESDIQIVQGRAAIEYRSYHGGETVIRATSPGLADATITITTIGEPQFVPGVTPPARPRPYVPPAESEAARAAMRNAVNVALNRPSRASGEAAGHPARHANDGDGVTFWQCDESLGWWMVDLEGFYQLASLKMVFPAPDAAQSQQRYFVATSMDAQHWTYPIKRLTTTEDRPSRTEIFPPATIARYVRIDFPAGPYHPALAEVELHGIIAR
jgi:hypothetical protein